MESHIPYERLNNRNADFIVNYEVDIDSSLTGIKLLQGMRCDFLFESESPINNSVYMIWPEILNSSGDVILDKIEQIPDKGKAFMWIFNDDEYDVIKERIKVGDKGYWVIGTKRIANVEVTKWLGTQRSGRLKQIMGSPIS